MGRKPFFGDFPFQQDNDLVMIWQSSSHCVCIPVFGGLKYVFILENIFNNLYFSIFLHFESFVQAQKLVPKLSWKPPFRMGLIPSSIITVNYLCFASPNLEISGNLGYHVPA